MAAELDGTSYEDPVGSDPVQLKYINKVSAMKLFLYRFRNIPAKILRGSAPTSMRTVGK